MARPRRRGATPPERVGNLERSPRWAGLRAGDAVTISEMRLRGATWSFVAHVRNVESGEEWVEVVGGRAGDRATRSFPPERVFPPSSNASASSDVSYAQAPQLPFG
jgi:hypothetical protein